jgi:hypothetical protein
MLAPYHVHRDGTWCAPANAEELQQVVELAMDVANNSNRCSDIRHVLVPLQNLLCLHNNRSCFRRLMTTRGRQPRFWACEQGWDRGDSDRGVDTKGAKPFRRV